jgi:hypothetical protein
LARQHGEEKVGEEKVKVKWGKEKVAVAENKPI